MFRIHHPLYLPITPADDHSAIGLDITAPGAHLAACLDRSPHPAVFPGTFYCTKPPSHPGHHVGAASRPDPSRDPIRTETAHPATSDTRVVVAEWDDHRNTDGRA